MAEVTEAQTAVAMVAPTVDTTNTNRTVVVPMAEVTEAQTAAVMVAPMEDTINTSRTVAVPMAEVTVVRTAVAMVAPTEVTIANVGIVDTVVTTTSSLELKRRVWQHRLPRSWHSPV